MDLEDLITYCENKIGVTLETPFGPDTLVFKVNGKMFCLTGLESTPFRINLKNTPEKNTELREAFDSIIEGYHMHKKHWITLTVNNLKPNLVKQLIDESYELVANQKQKK